MKKRQGFTLIELVVVIAILGILAGIAIPRFINARAVARGAKLVGDMRAIDSVCAVYIAKTGGLPTDIDDLTNDTTGAPLLAIDPQAPAKDEEFVIKQNDGTEATFFGSGDAYELVEGRAVYSCTTESKKTVDFYLGF